MKISPERAYEAAATAARSGGPPLFKKPLAIWGRSYVFSKPYKDRIVLDGYFVDGDTGAVEYRETGRVLR